ncbi:MAG: hypothetical protein P8P29_00745 [Flavobacteriaceae bacterium]|nr:hypothetical protein [Flavobacteriaceae bacterium]
MNSETINKELAESPEIDINLEYFAFTTEEFLIYSKEKQSWNCLITKLIIPGSISQIIGGGRLHLHVERKRITSGVWCSAKCIDSILDLYNKGKDSKNWINFI